MESTIFHRNHENPTFLPSPNSHSSNSSTSSSGNGLQQQQQQHQQQQQPTPPPTPPSFPHQAPKPITRSESANPYPTTFVQADTSSFKQVVQMLTGSSETAKQASLSNNNNNNSVPDPPSKTHIPPIKSMMPKKQNQSGFKLYERRNSIKNLRINPLIPIFAASGSSHNSLSGFSPRKPEILSPSILDFPALALSPVTPLIPDPFDRSANAKPGLDTEAEEKAIKEKGFFLHPSPSTTPRESEPPRLLPLFPTTSPRVSGSSPP